MTKEALFALMKGTVIVSCQATPGEPLYDRERSVMPLMARAAKLAGAKMIRTSSVRDIIEIKEETGVTAEKLTELKSVAFVPAEVVAKNLRAHWDKNIFVIPEYSFAFECNADPTISREHCEYQWLPYDVARKLLKWDSNKVAMYEIMCRLRNNE